MSRPFDVPSVVALAPVAVVLTVVMVWRLRRRVEMTAAHLVTGLLVCVYALVVFDETMQPFSVGISPYAGSWRYDVTLTFMRDLEQITDVVANALLFAPLGVFLPLLARVRSWWQVTAIGLLTSLAVEGTQFLLDQVVSKGRVADLNDLVGDVLGVVLGYAAFRTVSRSRPGRALLTRLTWPPSRGHDDRAGASRRPSAEATGSPVDT